MPYGNYSKGSKAAASAMRKYARKKKYDGDMDGDKAEEREDSSDYGKTMKRLKRSRKNVARRQLGDRLGTY